MGIYEDDKFIKYLLEQRSASAFVFNSIKVEFVLHNVKQRLSTYLGRHVPIDLVRVKFREMRQKVNLFNNILAAKGVIYDSELFNMYLSELFITGHGGKD